ncbi:MAG: ferredoxin [Micromonosporaceae bacterium]|nr:ferredoxin [Micromonosporaceae bacterium]
MATAVGFFALAMLWLGLVLGMVLRDGWAVDRVRPATLAALHRTAVACGLMLAVVHGLAQLAIPSGATRVVDVLIPFTHRDDAFGVGLGVVGMELTVVVAGSVALRRVIGYHKWRMIHRLAYLAFALILGHIFVMGVGRYPALVLGPVIAIGVGTVVLGLATAGWFSHLPVRLRDVAGSRRWGKRVSVYVDTTRCVHFGFCQHEAPHLFELRENGRLEYASTVRADQIEAAIKAARACPTRAILLSKQAGRVVKAYPVLEEDDPQQAKQQTEGGNEEHVVS